MDGNWAACFSYIDALHTGEFMGIPATNKRVTIPYMDFWEIHNGRIKRNPVSVDLAQTCHDLGWDVFDGKGWEAFDEGRAVPPQPAA